MTITSSFFRPFLFVLAWAVILGHGCAKVEIDDDDTDTDADADTDTDSDTDSDTDTDSDSDSDSDTDTDTDADSDTDTEIDGGTLPDGGPSYECPYNCVTASFCNSLGGDIEPLYECTNPGDICCDADGDSDSDVCLPGPCCVNGHPEPTTTACDSVVEYACSTTDCGADLQHRITETMCDGVTSGCNGDVVEGTWTLDEDCTPDQTCEIDTEGFGQCATCLHGCVLGECNRVDWVTVTGGAFSMGSVSGGDEEEPVHTVTLANFDIGRTEVTVWEYAVCLNDGGCTSEPLIGGDCNWGTFGKEYFPVNCVNWNQALEFCTWAGGGLPSEAQWEYAARNGPTGNVYPWGDTPVPSCSNVIMNEGGAGCGLMRTWESCSKAAGNTTMTGLCDMSGNVWEWMQDWYHSDYTSAPVDGTAWETPTGTVRVTKSGGYVDHSYYMRASARNGAHPGFQDSFLGFRCAR